MSIASRVAMIRQRAAEAALRAGRDPAEIRLMAVSKFVDRARIDEALAAGIDLLGESRVQEIRDKYSPPAPRLGEGIELHMIGSLQRNKVRQATLMVSCIQSIDRDELILELAKECEKQDRRMGIFLELNTAEESKAGYPDYDALSRAVELALLHDVLDIRGLMTMAPLVNDEDEIRMSFRSLAACKELLSRSYPELSNLELSMGMSNDFELAIEEGANIIRVGTLLFEGIQT